MAKQTSVFLRCEALGEREFEITHAETLLRMKPNGGWELSDANFEFKNGTIVRRNQEKSNGKAQKSND